MLVFINNFLFRDSISRVSDALLQYVCQVKCVVLIYGVIFFLFSYVA